MTSPAFERLIPFALFLALAAALTAAAHHLQRRWRDDRLRSFTGWLLFWNSQGLLGLLLLDAAPAVMPAQAVSALFLVGNLLFIPLHGLAAFFHLQFTRGLVGRPLPRAVKSAFLIVFPALFLAVMARDLIFFSPFASGAPVVVRAYSLYLMTAVVTTSLLLAALSLLRRRGDPLRRDRLFLTLLLALAFFASLALMLLDRPPGGALGQRLLTGVVIFGGHLPALWVLRRLLRSQATAPAAFRDGERGFLAFCGEFRLSPRESEVMRLVLQGKNNAAMERELFVSLDTVKKHLYHIYRKTGVNNRLELFHLVQKWTPAPQGGANTEETEG